MDRETLAIFSSLYLQRRRSVLFYSLNSVPSCSSSKSSFITVICKVPLISPVTIRGSFATGFSPSSSLFDDTLAKAAFFLLKRADVDVVVVSFLCCYCCWSVVVVVVAPTRGIRQGPLQDGDPFFCCCYYCYCCCYWSMSPSGPVTCAIAS